MYIHPHRNGNDAERNKPDGEYNMARTATFSNKKTLVSALAAPEKVSYYLKRELIEKGYLKPVKVSKTTRGRPAFNYEQTCKARGLLALARNWK